jgi:hypothetical protein
MIINFARNFIATVLIIGTLSVFVAICFVFIRGIFKEF